jgi:hypothetical protein
MSSEADLPSRNSSGMEGAGTVLATLDDYDDAAALIDRLARARSQSSGSASSVTAWR